MLNKILNKVRTFFSSDLFLLIILLISIPAIIWREQLIIPVLWILAQITALIMFLSPNGKDTIFPILCVLTIGALFVGDLETIIPYLYWTIPFIVSLIFHIIFYHKKFTVGPTFWGLIAFSFAILISGFGTISLDDYFNPISILYVCGLTFGMVLVYWFYKSEFSNTEQEECIKYLLKVFLALAVLCCCIFSYNFLHIMLHRGEENSFGYSYLREIPFRNTIANLLMIALPAPFYFAVKSKKNIIFKMAYIAIGCWSTLSLICSGARTGLLFGIILFIICLIYYYYDKTRTIEKLISVSIIAIFAFITYKLIGEYIIEILDIRLIDGNLFSTSESRMELLIRSVDDFLNHPLFGIGVGSLANYDLYHGYACLIWYHLYFPQIWGSMGMTGLLAFCFQSYTRFKVSMLSPTRASTGLLLCYIGLFLYSQTDPGEFVPLPFALIATIIFAALDNKYNQHKNDIMI